ncbi:membrane protein [Methanoculleus sediminis]|uniref:Membrane protein n=1 Tax=Methanoculleus sediminis TaxID=1550566 RepID=A0A0H1R5H9_9EURY|nr:membrane protein [Methanoculleus sediminis]KLK87937.1 membrane protein [Methanoculleus sediminis]
MFNLPTTNIGGPEVFVLEFGDIVAYFSPYTAALFVFALIFTALVIVSRPERQVDIAFGGDAYYTKEVDPNLLRFQRFMAIACGLATLGAVMTGDVFNFTLFASMVGITNIGIVAAYRNRHVLNAAFQYGIVAMLATVPLFGGAAIVLAGTGTLSMWELFGGAMAVPLIAKAFLVLGVMGEGMAPFYIAKAEITRAQGAPFILMVHVSSLLLFLRVTEIVISM